MVVARKNCSRMRVERRSCRSCNHRLSRPKKSFAYTDRKNDARQRVCSNQAARRSPCLYSTVRAIDDPDRRRAPQGAVRRFIDAYYSPTALNRAATNARTGLGRQSGAEPGPPARVQTHKRAGARERVACTARRRGSTGPDQAALVGTRPSAVAHHEQPSTPAAGG